MKNILLATALFFIGITSFGQWETNGNNIYFNGGNVGINKENPDFPLQVVHPPYSITEDGTNHKIGTDIGIYNTYNIPNGKTENGYRMGLNISALVTSSNFQGTLKKQIGIRIQQGAYTGSGSGTIDDCYGLYLQGLNSRGTTINNKYGIFQTGADFKNYFEGNVGIGTSAPKAQFVTGSDFGASVSGASCGKGIFGSNLAVIQGGDNHCKLYTPADHTSYGYSGMECTWGNIAFYTSYGSTTAGEVVTPTPRMYIKNSNGNVGIGCTSPDAKLVVKGTIKATEIKVVDGSALPCSDYVFENDYNLRSLEDVESFVQENKHLPEVPSAQEFKENGYSIGEMDDILLRKIEELTLYVIEQQKTIGELKNKIEILENK